MANCTSSCTGSVTALLTSILEQEIAIFVRLSQVVQAFGGQSTEEVVIPENVCSNSELNLLAAILAQRQSNFNSLQEVLLAV